MQSEPQDHRACGDGAGERIRQEEQQKDAGQTEMRKHPCGESCELFMKEHREQPKEEAKNEQAEQPTEYLGFLFGGEAGVAHWEISVGSVEG